MESEEELLEELESMLAHVAQVGCRANAEVDLNLREAEAVKALLLSIRLVLAELSCRRVSKPPPYSVESILNLERYVTEVFSKKEPVN